MLRVLKFILPALILLTAAACNSNESANKDADYDETKKMVVDILQTDDGKKALKDILSDKKMKQQLVMDSDVVKKAITETLDSDKGKKMWKKLFEDPDFLKKFASSMSDEQKKLMKQLMEDSEYQKQMIELMQDPKMTKEFIQALKSQEFRSHLEETIQQTLETPTFQKKIQDILLEAAEEQNKGGGGKDKDKEKDKDKKDDNNESSGDSEEDSGGDEMEDL